MLLMMTFVNDARHEWVFITDTLECLKGLATDIRPVALVDKLALGWPPSKQLWTVGGEFPDLY